MATLSEIKKGRTPESCAYFEKCGAPLCPLDELIDNYQWTQEDEVCINNEFQKLKFIKQQRIIHNKRTFVDGSFNRAQLKNMYSHKKL